MPRKKKLATHNGAAASDTPHSWDLGTWPPSVWPGSGGRAHWIIRTHTDELTELGAVSRVGKTLVILGRPWARFIERNKANVLSWQSNNPEMRRAP